MAENMLLKSTVQKRHYHIVYLKNVMVVDPATGEQIEKPIAISSENNGHTHELIIDANEELSFLPAGKSAHIHDIDKVIQYEGSEIEENDETKIKSYITKLCDEAFTIEKKSIQHGEESEEFYAGDQWSEDDLAILNAENRPAITINEISAKIDILCGFQRQNRTDIRFFPIESSDDTVGQVATEAIKNIFDINSMQVVESDVFHDLSVVGKGVFHYYVDYDRNMLGQIVVEKTGWKDTLFGPHAKQDLSDCEYIVKRKSVPKSKLKLMYSDKKKEIDSMFDMAETLNTRSHMTIEGMEYKIPDNLKVIANAVDIYTQNITVKEIWEKNYITLYSIVNYNDGFVDTVDKISKEEINIIETLGFSVIKRTLNNMLVTVMAGDVILDRRIEDQDFFPVVPVYAKIDSEGNYYGKVEDVKDVQRELNKLHSQTLDILNKCANFGYYYENQTFESPRDEAAWRADIAKPGFASKVKDLSKIPLQTQGVRMPSELTNLMTEASNKIYSVMNISPELMGARSEREVSSVAIIEKRRNNLTANEFLYDNLAQAKKLLAKNILKLVQKIYSPERLFRLIGRNPTTEEEQIKMQQLQEACIKLINQENVDELDIAVEISPNSPTTRSANFALLLEMSRMMPIPPQILIDASDLPGKERIMSIITGQQQAEAEAENKKFETEILKTQIANSGNQQPQGQPNFQQQF